MSTEAPRTPRRKRPRSPSYPSISLGEAVQRARQVYEAEGRNSVPFESILADWGYSSKSGAGSVVIAALRKYGLLVYEGKNAKLSDLAFRILWDEGGTGDGREALKEAALNPTIHAELWHQYRGELPSDGALRLELRKRNFAESAIPEVINVLRSTLDYAGLTTADNVVEKDDRPSNARYPMASMPPVQTMPTSAPNAPAPIQLPLQGGTVVTLQASGPVTPEAWEQMMGVFTALRSGFVTEDAKPRDSSPPDPE